MRVAIYSRTPLAAAPLELWKALRKYTDVDARLINETLRYGDGRTFPGDMASGTEAAAAVLKEAEVWHVHNYLPASLPGLRNGHTRVLAQFHSIPRLGNWQALMQFASLSYTIRQPLQEREYRLPTLPNLIDPDEYRPIRRPGPVTIGFAPTNRQPLGNPASKGRDEVRSVLDEVARETGAEIVWIEGVSYAANLEMKAHCHILIDDVVTGNWHRTSLEGACFACAVINRNTSAPFVFGSLPTLKEKLCWLVANRSALAALQEEARCWILQRWHAMDLVKEYVAVYKKLTETT